MERKKRNEREANRIHCRQTRERKKEKEIALKEEVEALTLYRAIVEDGPDLFSCHRVELDAPFTFLCDNYYQRLQLVPEDVLGRPLASIVDPGDAFTLRTAVCQVLNTAGGSTGGGAGPPQSGTLVDLRVTCGRISCQASMTMIIGSQGLIIVTRLYDVCFMGDARGGRSGQGAGGGADLGFRHG